MHASFCALFAHFLHIQDTLETAGAQGLVSTDIVSASLPDQLDVWARLVISLNEVSRSLGVRDPYPFIINAAVSEKLEYVRQAIGAVATQRG